MNAPATFMKAAERPAWLRQSDRDTDVTDAAADALGYEIEDVYTAHFERVDAIGSDSALRDVHYDEFQLLGVEIRDTTGVIYRDREWVSRVMGTDFIWMIERYETECEA